MSWTTNDELVGQRVLIYTGYGDEEPATVLAVHRQLDLIKVRADDDGETLIGNQWEHLED